MTKDRLLERIRKLLALTASSNANEAAVARSKAAKLMEEHGLSEQEVLDSEPGSQMFEMSMGIEGFSARWKFVLVAMVARAHGCEVVGLRRGKLRKVKMVGAKHEVAKASKLFGYLLDAIEGIVRLECSNPPDEVLERIFLGLRWSLGSYLDSFRWGAVEALAERLAAKKKSPAPKPAPGALVPYRTVKVKARDYITSKFPKARPFSSEDSRVEIDDLGFARGYLQAMHIKMPKESRG